MRIISGLFKGKKIIQPKDLKTRPLKDLTKESIFNIISHSNKFKIDINKANILDIFSGVGSFGLECLSRGAKYVSFIENYKDVVLILKKNLSNLKSVNNFEIYEKDAFELNTYKEINTKFDIIFLDPPYKEKNLDSILKNILTQNILNNNGIIILHRHKKTNDIFSNELKILEEKKYGISKIIFISH
tara:strand:+ start:814 stop:1374 length:561 start_codon:yes stop_codon:yes gene_type:complete